MAKRLVVALAVLVLVCAERSARADDGRAPATAAAVVPGVVAHGSGHWVRGRKGTARTLLLGELVGLGAMGAGASVLYFSGASRRLAAPAIALSIVGSGLFVASWLADLYGASTDEPTGEPRVVLPLVEASLGYRYVRDPAFAYRGFVTTGFDLRFGRVRVSPEGWFSAGHANERLRLAAAYRFVGPTTRAPRSAGTDGSFVDLELAGVRHAFPPERFTMTGGELVVAGRLDLARVAPTLRGSFFETSLGVALARHSYAVEGRAADGAEQLLGRWAYGLWLGRPSSVWAEVSAFYEHRHDGYAGGLKLPGLFSGVLGSFGARALAWLSEDLGALVEAQAGSAAVVGASVLVRQAVTP